MDAATLQPIERIPARLCSPGGQAYRLAATLEYPNAAAAPAVVEAARKGEISINAAFKTVAPKAEPKPAPIPAAAPPPPPAAPVRRMKNWERFKDRDEAVADSLFRGNPRRPLRPVLARTIATCEEAAAGIGIPVVIAHNYAHIGNIAAAYLDGKKNADTYWTANGCQIVGAEQKAAEKPSAERARLDA